MWAGRDAAHDYLRPTVEAVLDGTLEQREPYRSIIAAWRGTSPTAPESP